MAFIALSMLGWSLLGSAFLLPGHYPPWDTFQQQWTAFLGALMVTCCALHRAGLEGRLAIPPLAVLVSALSVVPLMQYAGGQIWFASDAVLAAAYLVAFALSMTVGRWLCVQRPTGSALTDKLLATLLFAALASALIAVLQWQQLTHSLFLADLPRGETPYGNLAQRNHQSSLLLLGLVAALYFYETGRFGRTALGVVACLLGWGVVMTQSRTGWLSVALLVLWTASNRRRALLRLPKLALAIGALAFATAVLLWGSVNQALLLAPPQLLADRLQVGTRPVLWATLWDALWRRPLAGYGWGQITLAQQEAVLNHPPNIDWLLNSHNLVLDQLLYNGMPIGLAVVAAVAWWLFRQVGACRSKEQWALLSGVGVLLVHAMFEYPLDYAFFLLPFGMMMGALDALYPKPQRTVRVSAKPIALLTAGMASLLIWVGVEYMEVEAATRQLRFVLQRIGVDKVWEAPPLDVRLLDEPREHYRFWQTPARAGMPPDELEWMKRVSMREARPSAMLRYAAAAGMNGRPQEARLTLERLCHMHKPQRCDEGRASWHALRAQFPLLDAISYPATPTPR